MKIIELLDPKTTVGKDVKDLAKGAFGGVADFVQQAGGPDIKGAGKYFGPTLKGGKDADIGSRSVGADSGLDEILVSMYGENLTDDIRNDWKAAIESGDENKIKAVNDKYENEPGIRPKAQSETNPGKLKLAHKNRIYALAGLPSDENL